MHHRADLQESIGPQVDDILKNIQHPHMFLSQHKVWDKIRYLVKCLLKNCIKIKVIHIWLSSPGYWWFLSNMNIANYSSSISNFTVANYIINHINLPMHTLIYNYRSYMCAKRQLLNTTSFSWNRDYPSGWNYTFFFIVTVNLVGWYLPPVCKVW